MVACGVMGDSSGLSWVSSDCGMHVAKLLPGFCFFWWCLCGVVNVPGGFSSQPSYYAAGGLIASQAAQSWAASRYLPILLGEILQSEYQQTLFKPWWT